MVAVWQGTVYKTAYFLTTYNKFKHERDFIIWLQNR